MKKLKRYETFENLKASNITTPIESAAQNAVELKNLFANLRSYKITKNNSLKNISKLNGE
jgi:hypothetical protein